MKCLTFVLVALACVADCDAAPVRVTLKRTATVTGPVVLLGDVATLSGESKSKSLLSAIPIDPAPSPGVVRRYSQREVRVRLLAAGLDDEAFVFFGPEISRVRGAYLTISSKRLIDLARDETNRSGIPTGKWIQRPPALSLHVGSGALSLRVKVVAKRRGKVVLEVVAFQQGRESGRRKITLEIISAPARTAPTRRMAQPLRRAARRRAPRTGRKTQPTRRALIEAGDPVRVVVREMGIELEIGGLARRSGARGDLIRVRIPSTQRTLTARVLGPGRVLLETGSDQ